MTPHRRFSSASSTACTSASACRNWLASSCAACSWFSKPSAGSPCCCTTRSTAAPTSADSCACSRSSIEGVEGVALRNGRRRERQAVAAAQTESHPRARQATAVQQACITLLSAPERAWAPGQALAGPHAHLGEPGALSPALGRVGKLTMHRGLQSGPHEVEGAAPKEALWRVLIVTQANKVLWLSRLRPPSGCQASVRVPVVPPLSVPPTAACRPHPVALCRACIERVTRMILTHHDIT